MDFPDFSQDYYYYPYISKEGYVTIVCLYDEDLYEYNSARFRYDEEGYYVRFDEEGDNFNEKDSWVDKWYNWQ